MQQLELEATPLPPAIRALCYGGPWDGAVMMAPVPRTRLFGGMTLFVQIDGRSAHFRTHADAAPWMGGGYVLNNAPLDQRQAQQQVRAILGEPHDAGVCWRWCTEGTDAFDHVCVLTERMVRTHVFCLEQREPYEPSGAVRELAQDLGVEIHEHPDGDVSFRRPADHGISGDDIVEMYRRLERDLFNPNDRYHRDD